MTVARLLAVLLGAAPADHPMARLLVLDEEALARRVRPSPHHDSDGPEIRRPERTLPGMGAAGMTPRACAFLASARGRTS
ncbi:hypothetical protein ACLQ2E_35490 [Streptomyces lavendulocolor]